MRNSIHCAPPVYRVLFLQLPLDFGKVNTINKKFKTSLMWLACILKKTFLKTDTPLSRKMRYSIHLFRVHICQRNVWCNIRNTENNFRSFSTYGKGRKKPQNISIISQLSSSNFKTWLSTENYIITFKCMLIK